MLSLEARPREIFGRKLNKSRKTGMVPAILYGKQVGKPMPLFVFRLPFGKIFEEAGESTIINLVIEGEEPNRKKEFPVLIYDVQRDSVTLDPIHADFYQLPLEEKITVTVPLVFVGSSPAAVEKGGTLVRNIQEVKVRALPLQLPREIEVDVSFLKSFDQVLTIGDIMVPAGAEIVERDKGDIVARVVEFKEEKAEEVASSETAPVGEVKLSEERGKKEEEAVPTEEKAAQQQ